MYCVKCGVELADSEKKCPLCGTVAFHPEISRPKVEKPFPEYRVQPGELVNHSATLFILTILSALPVVVLLLCDWRINNGVVWSGYASGAIILAYIIVILPMWFHAPNPVIFVPADFVATAVYLMYINWATGGHWFLSFALPVVLGIGILVCAVTALVKYLRRGYLFIFGGAMIGIGMLSVMVEYLINRTFQINETFFWSLFPLAAGLILGLMLIIIGICKPLRESLNKKFFI